MKIVKGQVTIDGQVYTAFENSFSKKWYIVRGSHSSDPVEVAGIDVRSGKKALEHWLGNK